MLATVEAFQLLPALIDDLLKRHGLDRATLRRTQRVGLQVMLDVLRDIESNVGPSKLRQVGSNVVETALFPPELRTVEDVLLGLDAIYLLNHSGDVGHYRSRRTADGAIRIECATPYPATFERGLVEGLAKNRLLTKGKRYLVGYEDGTPADPDVTCICTVRAR